MYLGCHIFSLHAFALQAIHVIRGQEGDIDRVAYESLSHSRRLDRECPTSSLCYMFNIVIVISLGECE